ncbi:hypothetical protein [Bradyrhizobium sp. 76]|uniref:hypothetical protein n=1 Tax=Bradyrhizobium sp. 76 TaxID=2782680 RepID=UPI001FFB5A1E|nr:hypothetical protein [Bradyrhizobium sp. 76]MCK1409538.1 hypothetical protein [Bradyrhizobium sp. 76]
MLPLLVVGFLVVLLTTAVTQAGPPDIPAKPKSEDACLNWGRSYQAHFDEIISRARAADALCKQSYKGSFQTVSGGCPNTNGGPVTYQNPCDEASKWVQCASLGYFRGLHGCASKLTKVEKGPDQTSQTEYVLDQDDIKFLKDLQGRDEFLRQLANSSQGIEILGKILEYGAEGPAKLLAQWNLGLIKGWRIANSRLEGINKAKVCDDITAHFVSTKALLYFDGLYKARGCG